MMNRTVIAVVMFTTCSTAQAGRLSFSTLGDTTKQIVIQKGRAGIRVRIADGMRDLGVVMLDNSGNAKLTIPAFSAGPHTITAVEWGTGQTAAQPLHFIERPHPSSRLTPASTYPTGFRANVLASGDLSRSGFQDLVLGGPDGISLVYNRNGVLSTPHPLKWTARSVPTAIVVNDFDGDGLNDLAITCADGRVALFLNQGGEKFSGAYYYAAGAQPSSIVSADLNGDGIPDLAVANQGSNNISLLYGNGDGTFRPAIALAAGYSPRAVLADDFNGDGIPDLATANFATNDVSILLGDGRGTFRTGGVFAVGNGPARLITADFDEDGSPDLAVLNQIDGSISILLNNRAAVFQMAETIPGNPLPLTGMVAGDTDGDGHVDLLIHVGDVIQVRPGTGHGAFTDGYSCQATGSPLLMTLQDLNPDRSPDAALIDGSGQIIVLSSAAAISAPAIAGPPPETDLRRPSVAVASTVSQSSDLKPSGSNFSSIGLTTSGARMYFSQSLTLTAIINPAKATGKVTFYDGTVLLSIRPVINGRASMTTNLLTAGVHALKASYGGDTTFQASTSSISIDTVLSLSLGGFQPPVAYTTADSPYAAVVADLNNDGNADLAVANSGSFPTYAGSVSVFLGNGDGTFRPPVTYATDTGSSFVAVADINGDGALELIVANWGGTVSVLGGKGDGTFFPATNYTVGNTPYALAVGDFTGDGSIDIAVSNNGDNTVTLLIGNGTGAFSSGSTYHAATAPQSIVTGDFNGDGIVDLAVAGTDGVAVLLGMGNAKFQPAVKYAAGANPYSIAVNDFNGDSKSDLAVANLDGGNVSILIGNGDGTFKSPVNYAAGANSEWVVTGDFNGDGMMDLAVANFGVSSGVDGNVTVLYGNGNGTFQAPLVYAGGANPFALAVGNLNADGASDLAVISINSNQMTVLLGKGKAFTPSVMIDSPLNNTVMSGTITISGWALNNTSAIGTAISKVQIALDGATIGNANYGISRPEVCGIYPGRPNCPNVGYTFSLSTAGLGNGYHTISVMATDTGNVPATGSATVTIAVTTPNSISGQVTVSGVPVSGVTVNVNGSQTLSTTTDALGNYGFTLAGGGTYTVAASRFGYSFSSPVTFSNVTTDQTANFTGVAVTGQRFYPVSPCRIADTRSGSGFGGAFGPPFLAADQTRSFPVGSSACGIPANATAYSLNVTVAPHGPLGLLTIWPAGQSMPNTSTLSALTATVVANAAIVPAGNGGAISIYANNATDVLLDINGYFAPPLPAGLQFYPVMPCRVVDTRAGAGFSGAFGAPSLAAGQTRIFPVGSSACGIPTTATAYALHFTAVPPGSLGQLTTWPTGQPMPNVSTLNSYTGTVVSNQAIVPAGTGGAISAYVNDATDLLVDINGYFAPPLPSGLNFYPVIPCRIADTRNGTGFGGPFGPPTMLTATERSFPIAASACGIPSSAQAYSLNFTVVPPAPLGFLTAWPTATTMPNVSTLNSYLGTVVANGTIVPAGAGGAISIYANSPTDVLFEVNGYFAQ